MSGVKQPQDDDGVLASRSSFSFPDVAAWTVRLKTTMSTDAGSIR